MRPADSVRRRAVLAGCASLLTPLAGCQSLFGRSSDSVNYRPPPLHGILIENRYTEQKQLELLVERDGNIVHWNTRTIPTLGKKKDGGWTGVVIAIRDREWMGCGTYEITARLPNESESGTLDFRNLEPESGDNGKFRPVEVRIEFSNEWDGLAIDTTRLDDPVIDCEETNTETRTTQR